MWKLFAIAAEALTLLPHSLNEVKIKLVDDTVEVSFKDGGVHGTVVVTRDEVNQGMVAEQVASRIYFARHPEQKRGSE